MNRAEHLQWCKDRAVKYINKGDVVNGLASFISDMSKHEATANHSTLPLMSMLMFDGQLATAQEARKFIQDFN